MINSELLLTKCKNKEIKNNQKLLFSEDNENTKNESNDESGQSPPGFDFITNNFFKKYKNKYFLLPNKNQY